MYDNIRFVLIVQILLSIIHSLLNVTVCGNVGGATFILSKDESCKVIVNKLFASLNELSIYKEV